jgi:hypothetical protein
MQINTLDSFLEKYIHGYLFTDVSTIKESVSKDHHPGNAAYLMTSALCSGIEFLGFLLRKQKDEEEPSSSFAFEHYCKHYLSRVDSRYEAFGIIGRELIRNGIAHSFATKGKIGITRQGDRDETHLVRYADEGVVVLNPDYLYEDFKKSYEAYAAPRLVEGGDLRQRAEHNYELLKNKYNDEIERTEQAVGNKLDDWPWLFKDFSYEADTLEVIEVNGTIPIVS